MTVERLDEIIHQPVRLRIMATLRALPAGEQIEFVRLRAIVGATEGNLGAHIAALERAGYVAVAKDFVGKKPRTRVAMTRERPQGVRRVRDLSARHRERRRGGQRGVAPAQAPIDGSGGHPGRTPARAVL